MQDSGIDASVYQQAPSLDRDIKDLALRVVDSISAMVAYWDKDQICLFANEAYQEWFGKSRDEVIGMSMQDLLGPLYTLNLPYITEALRGHLQVFERTIPLPDGRIKHSLATYTPDIVGVYVVGFFVHVADITALKDLETELREAKDQAQKLATHDFLTGLPNRRMFTERASVALAAAERLNRLVAFMVMDMNGFKSVNDTYGHAEGDRLLTITADRLASTIRQSDTLARMGGDEFTLLSVDIESKTAAHVLANRLVASVSRPFACNGAMLNPSLSIGIAMYPHDGTTLEMLMSVADIAMYRAKHQGKTGNNFAFVSGEE
ncbi:MAG: GGDEF domain-containing protein [Capsulimonas sp.]|uniref:GGDEF domain-containing protein n=1 Tax=Capsulimonas sp. TaxID=2494211 RepID=UPI0032635EF3